MTNRVLLGCACLPMLAAATAASAAFTCKDPETGAITIQQTACAVLKKPSPPPAKPPCELDPDKLKAAVRLERQFLTRFADETAHRRAQLADLQPIVDRVRRGHLRYDELLAQREPLEKEAEFYKDKPLPAWLKTKLDANAAQFAALVDILRGAEQDIAEIRARYECQRTTFARLWSDAAPGSSACDRPACAPP